MTIDRAAEIIEAHTRRRYTDFSRDTMFGEDTVECACGATWVYGNEYMINEPDHYPEIKRHIAEQLAEAGLLIQE